jgi:transketolase
MATAVLQQEDTRDLALRLRRHAVRMCNSGGSAHVGSCLSMADIVAVLFGEILRIDPHEPRWPGRDRFILSKGHAGACIYAALAERGFFPVRELAGHYRNGSRFSGHVSSKGIPGVEVSTGSLGHGLGLAVGVATQLRRQGGDRRTFVLMSDGECDEGSVWEAALFASQHRLGQLCAIIDFNKLQGLAAVAETVALEPFGAKWRAFGWRVLRIDGHDHAALREALSTPSAPGDRPLCIIADTVKGKGVSFMENQVLWHYRVPAGDEFAAALRELGDTEPARDA